MSADRDARTGITPLQVALLTRRERAGPTLTALLAHRAHPNTPAQFPIARGDTALHAAAGFCGMSVEVWGMLLAAVASMEAVNAQGKTPLNVLRGLKTSGLAVYRAALHRKIEAACRTHGLPKTLHATLPSPAVARAVRVRL